MIHRLDLADAQRAERAGGALPSAAATAQLTWTALGLALFVAVLLLVRDHRRLQRFTYTSLLLGLVLLLLPRCCRPSAASVNGAADLDPARRLLVPARRAGEDRC